MMMMMRFALRARARTMLALCAIFALVASPATAQDRLRTYPGYERYDQIGRRIPQLLKSGALRVTWSDDSQSFEYERDGKRYRYDLDRGTAVELPGAVNGAGIRLRGPARGRQYASAISPDSTLEAFYRDRNLWLRAVDGSAERAITTDGSESARTKNGSASWVYGEELGQNTAMWWSPDGRRIAYYRFDESGVRDYYLQLDQTSVQSMMDVEAYPKAGVDNPVVQLFVHDRETRGTIEIDVRDGQPFTDDVTGHYVYGIEWTPDGSELLIRRTNRRQNVMELTACSPETGSCRVVVREEWPASWTDNSPEMRWLADGRRFIWTSERTGFANYYLYDLDGALLATLTAHPFEVAGIEAVDEEADVLWYRARSGDNHMKVQLHRVGLDGRGDRRLTDPSLHHTVALSPDTRHFVDVAQTHESPPVTRLLDAEGRQLSEVAVSDVSALEAAGMQPIELFTYTSADGETELHGLLHRPSDFDASQRYPLLLSVYGGPGSSGARETFATPHPLTEYGFLIVTLDARSVGGRGKAILDAIYQKLGVVEIDDLAAAVTQLRERPYVDGERVGIYGTSYGGYAAAMALLRYPDVFHAAAAMSPVTDWKHYDTIYTERYMWTPQGNPDGYRAGSALTYVDDLKGRLMLYYGTADNNVHPSNSLELIAALQRAGKSFEVQVGPDRGHTALHPDRMMEFFIENLVLAQSLSN